MKVAQITKPHHFELVDLPEPQAHDEFVVLKVLSTPMCSEYRQFKSGLTVSGLGHEAAGEVVEVASSSKVKVGDRVSIMAGDNSCGVCKFCQSGYALHCQQSIDSITQLISSPQDDESFSSDVYTGTYNQYITRPDWLLTPIPEEISIDHGSMMFCGLGPSFGALQEMKATEGETVLMIGLGPVGLGGVINTVHRRGHAIGLDPNPYRRQLASDLGAMAVLDPSEEGALEQIMDLTKGIGVDAAVDCSANNPAGIKLALDALGTKGRLGLLGGQYLDKSKDFIHFEIEKNFVFKGISVHGAWMFKNTEAPQLMQVIRDSSSLLDKQITHRMPLSQAPVAFDLQSRGECGKIILHPWDD